MKSPRQPPLLRLRRLFDDARRGALWGKRRQALQAGHARGQALGAEIRRAAETYASLYAAPSFTDALEDLRERASSMLATRDREGILHEFAQFRDVADALKAELLRLAPRHEPALWRAAAKVRCEALVAEAYEGAVHDRLCIAAVDAAMFTDAMLEKFDQQLSE